MTAPMRSSSPPTTRPSISVSYIHPNSFTDSCDNYFQALHYIVIVLIATITNLLIDYSFMTNIRHLSYTITRNKKGFFIEWTSNLPASPSSNETQPNRKNVTETPATQFSNKKPKGDMDVTPCLTVPELILTNSPSPDDKPDSTLSTITNIQVPKSPVPPHIIPSDSPPLTKITPKESKLSAPLSPTGPPYSHDRTITSNLPDEFPHEYESEPKVSTHRDTAPHPLSPIDELCLGASSIDTSLSMHAPPPTTTYDLSGRDNPPKAHSTPKSSKCATHLVNLLPPKSGSLEHIRTDTTPPSQPTEAMNIPLPVMPVTPSPTQPCNVTSPLTTPVNINDPPQTTSALTVTPGVVTAPSFPALSSSQINNLFFHTDILSDFLSYYQARLFKNLSALDLYAKHGINVGYSKCTNIADAIYSITLHNFINNCTPPPTTPPNTNTTSTSYLLSTHRIAIVT